MIFEDNGRCRANLRLFATVIFMLSLRAVTINCQEKTAGPTASARGGFVITPVVYYTPETRIAFGIVGIHYFRLGRPDPKSRLSHYRFNFIRTQNKQSIAQVDYELYLAGGKFLLDGTAKYWLFPDRFYGIGNRNSEADREDFTSRNLRLQLNLQKRWGGNLFAGLRLDLFSLNVVETESDGRLAAGDIPGSRGGTLSALGLFSKWDSRDNTFSAAKGSYYAFFLNLFTPVLGSNFTFTQMILDARKYFPLGAAQVLAVQCVLKSVWGDCPLQTLPRFGGLNLMRGFFEGRYRDQNMLAVQAEYRRPLWGRFGFSAFAGAAQVQDRISRLALGEFHMAWGMGLRYKFNRRENLNIRLDAGFAGSADAPAFYLTFAEAF
jgi:outer membrane protein assembly factor BamA